MNATATIAAGAPASRVTVAAPRRCSLCRRPGHYVQTCPDADPTPSTPNDPSIAASVSAGAAEDDAAVATSGDDWRERDDRVAILLRSIDRSDATIAALRQRITRVEAERDKAWIEVARIRLSTRAPDQGGTE